MKSELWANNAIYYLFSPGYNLMQTLKKKLRKLGLTQAPSKLAVVGSDVVPDDEDDDDLEDTSPPKGTDHPF